MIDLPRTMLAPMAGYTDAGLRLLAKRYGCGITVTEMVSVCALAYGNSATKELLVNYEEGLKSVQLFGHDNDMFLRAFDVTDFSAFDIIDINMGCPVKKIVSGGDGSALLDNAEKASSIVKTVKSRTDKAVSVKMRLGRTNGINATYFAKTMQDSGADFLTVHGRTANQMYAGTVDYDAIEKIAKAVEIPVYANGNVDNRQKYLDMLSRGCYGVAVGRGALGKPYVFAELENQPYKFDLRETVYFHFDVLLRYLSEHVAVNEMKKHIAFYFKGKKGGKALTVKVNSAKSKAELLQFAEEYFTIYGEAGR